MSNKYGAKKTEIDGIVFDSKAEARRYSELKLMQYSGMIHSLECHPSWPLIVNGVKIGKYTADFRYKYYSDIDIDGDGRDVVEDVKGMRTRDYILRKKLMLAIHGIEVKEV